jgi:hypothetical protein
MDNIIGIDVSKDTLDVHRLADGSHCQIPNSTTGHTKLLKWIEARSTALVVFQATAAYHRQLEQRLSAKAVNGGAKLGHFYSAVDTISPWRRIPANAHDGPRTPNEAQWGGKHTLVEAGQMAATRTAAPVAPPKGVRSFVVR